MLYFLVSLGKDWQILNYLSKNAVSVLNKRSALREAYNFLFILYASVKVTEVPSFRNMRVILSAIEEYHSAASKKRSKKLTMERLGTTCAYTARSWWPTEEYIRSVPFCRYALECGESLSLQVTFSYDFVIFELNKTGPCKQPLISTLHQDEPSQ